MDKTKTLTNLSHTTPIHDYGLSFVFIVLTAHHQNQHFTLASTKDPSEKDEFHLHIQTKTHHYTLKSTSITTLLKDLPLQHSILQETIPDLLFKGDIFSYQYGHLYTHGRMNIHSSNPQKNTIESYQDEGFLKNHYIDPILLSLSPQKFRKRLFFHYLYPHIIQNTGI